MLVLFFVYEPVHKKLFINYRKYSLFFLLHYGKNSMFQAATIEEDSGQGLGANLLVIYILFNTK